MPYLFRHEALCLPARDQGADAQDVLGRPALRLEKQAADAPPDDRGEEILAGLNPAQREAVRATDGPVLIIAGPGSGKTRTLTHRIAYLLATEKAKPWQILALTFTNKAAREMKERVEKLVGEAARDMWMGTFHSVCARVMRVEAGYLGFSRDFTIYDTDDTERLLRQLMNRLNIDAKQYTPRAMRSAISSAKNQMVDPEEYARLARTEQQDVAARLYQPYTELLRRSNAMDFDDLLLKPIELLQQHEEVREKYQKKWRYVHIDEYQDTNKAQYELARLLSGGHQNLCVVGDDAQSIYAFRGADIGNILSFQRDYDGAEVIRLEQNYRSTKKILRLADSIISRNQHQLDKTLWTDNREGDDVVVMEALSEKDEAQKVERTIRDLRTRAGYGFQDFAVLYRTNAQSRALEEALRRGAIPYRVIGGLSFYQRREIKDVLAYLRLLVNPNDTASIRRVINTPTRGIGAKTEERVIHFAREEGITLWQAIERVQDAPNLSTRAKNAVEKFGFLISKHAAQIEAREGEAIARSLIEEAGIFKELKAEQTPENLARWENVQELLNGIAEFEGTHEGGLAAFLQDISLLTAGDEAEDDGRRVTLMTLHASKGLEFEVVFVCGMEEGLFPLSKAAQDREQLEEERRLFYVGATRAQSHLFLAHARSRYRYGEQQSGIRSRFLDELDEGVVRMESGARYEKKGGRFSASSGAKKGGYSGAGHDWRQNLREQPGHGGKKRRTVRQTKRRGSGERRVVYDEGRGEIVPGARVEHGTFGEGTVLALDGAGDNAAATVFFPGIGQKKLKLKFAKLKRVE